jgi:hypothetical protein
VDTGRRDETDVPVTTVALVAQGGWVMTCSENTSWQGALGLGGGGHVALTSFSVNSFWYSRRIFNCSSWRSSSRPLYRYSEQNRVTGRGEGGGGGAGAVDDANKRSAPNLPPPPRPYTHVRVYSQGASQHNTRAWETHKQSHKYA